MRLLRRAYQGPILAAAIIIKVVINEVVKVLTPGSTYPIILLGKENGGGDPWSFLPNCLAVWWY
jgi:hypothetical protein